MNNFLFPHLIRLFRIGARIFFALTILLAPFRLRLVLWSRPFYPVYSDYTDFLLFASDLALFFTLVFWACSLLVEPRKVWIGSPFVFILMAGLTAAGWISVLGSVDSILSQYQAVRFTFLLFYYLYIVNEITSVYWIVLPAALQGLIQAPVAVGQSLAQSSLGLQFLGEHMLDPIVPGTSIIPLNGERFLRAYGLADHPNILGGCLVFALVLLLALVLYGKQRKPIIAVTGFILIFPALLLTFSRSAWLSLFIAALFMLGIETLAGRKEALARAVLLGVASLAVAAPLLMNDGLVFEKRFNAGNVSEDGPMVERAYLLNAGNMLFVEHSALGVGLGASPLAMKLRYEDFPVTYQPPHYVPLTAALETGVVGGVFYLVLFLAPFADFLLHWRSYIQNPRAIGVLALILAITVISLFDYYTWLYAPGRLWQWLAWGLYSVVSEKVG